MNGDNRHLKYKDILALADKAVGKSFGELGLTEFRDKKNKGGYGTFIEENVFGYSANSDDNPDFIDEGIELKVTPVKQNNNGELAAKERLILNMINYVEEADATFETSSFYKKNKRLLIMFYSYLKNIPETDFKLLDYDLFEFEHSLEYQVIKRDWEIIHNKILAGKAHELSDSDTTFLGATTKSSNGTVRRPQPYGPDAKPRAYSFKGNFMTRLIREYFHRNAEAFSFVSEDEWMNNPLEDLYTQKLQKYVGKTVPELKRLLYINSKAKQVNFMIAQHMLGLSGRDSSTQEMLDAGMKLKTVQLNKDGYPTESMSFPYFDFTELINVQWEDSEIREDFLDWKLMIFIFKEHENSDTTFEGIKFWNIPNNIVDGVIKDMYVHCAKLVSTGTAFEYDKNGKVVDLFPKEKKHSNGVCHIRPHGKDKTDTVKLPVRDQKTGIIEYTRQCFWFNKKFILKMIA